ncbi:P-loop containing nucleoside triphosphate hydrolase protein [Entophlyctis helioformis]|nr:P-loop containing nucleoside triphosphate hydrolase protein [Entophlyctis helioformis]
MMRSSVRRSGQRLLGSMGSSMAHAQQQRIAPRPLCRVHASCALSTTAAAAYPLAAPSSAVDGLAKGIRSSSSKASAAPMDQAETFRKEFVYDKHIFWYPSHQTKALKQLHNGIHHIDVVVEVRDARVPITSINRQFDAVLGNRDRIVVYNKVDLANPNMRKPLTEALGRFRNEVPIFTCADRGVNAKMILDAAIARCRDHPERYPYLSMVVVGIPNVGKSSLINSLRRLGVKKGKVTAVGKTAGVTTAIQNRVKIYDDPPIYLVDTPGIFDPHVSSPIEGLKISLSGGTRDRLTEEIHVADYLLVRLNNSACIKRYPSVLGLDGPTDDIYTVLKHICRQKNYLLDTRGRLFNLSAARAGPPRADGPQPPQNGRLDPLKVADSYLDIDQGARFMLDQYREGAFGPLTLDDCSPAALEAALTGINTAKDQDEEEEGR